MGNGCQFCQPPVHVVAVLLYLSVLPFPVENLIWIWLYQFRSSLIYFEYILLTITIVRQETTIIKNSFSCMKTVYCIVCLSLLLLQPRGPQNRSLGMTFRSFWKIVIEMSRKSHITEYCLPIKPRRRANKPLQTVYMQQTKENQPTPSSPTR